MKILSSAIVSLTLLSGTQLLASGTVNCNQILQRMCAMMYDPVTCTYTGSQDLTQNEWKASNLCEAHKQTDYFACINQDTIDDTEFRQNLSCKKDQGLQF